MNLTARRALGNITGALAVSAMAGMVAYAHHLRVLAVVLMAISAVLTVAVLIGVAIVPELPRTMRIHVAIVTVALMVALTIMGLVA